MKNKNYISVPELAGILGVSRITVFNRIKKGEIKAEKIGRNYAISKKSIDYILGKKLSDKKKKVIEAAYKRTIDEYGETLKLLGKD